MRGLRAKGNFIDDGTGLEDIFESLCAEELEVKSDKDKAADEAYEKLSKIAEEQIVHKEVLREAMEKIKQRQEQ